MSDGTQQKIVEALLEPCYSDPPTASAILICLTEGQAEMVSINIDSVETVQLLEHLLVSFKLRLGVAQQPSMLQ